MSKRSLIIAPGICSLALSALAVMPQRVAAQEQENPSTPGQIPDPSTYQGSTVLQQQSDQQDQSFRQQQQQQSNSYGNYGSPQSYSQYGGNGQPRESPASLCNKSLERSASLAPLRGLVELGYNTRDPRYFTITRKASLAEKPVLMKWLTVRLHCRKMPNGFSPDGQAMNLRASQITDRMIVALANGKMTYGDFNYTRAHNTAVLDNYLKSH
jgi:hypothetical protein